MKSRGKNEAAALPYATPAPRGESVWNRRGVVLVAGVILFLTMVALYAGVFIVEVVKGFLTDGLLAAAQVVSGAMLAAWVLRISHPASKTLAFVTAAGVGLGLIALVVLGLGLAGWLNRWTGIALLLVGPAIYLPSHLRRLEFEKVSLWLKAPAGWGWLWLLAVPMLAIACAGASVMPGLLWKPLDPHPFDVTAYHLQVPREWYESGRIIPLPHNVYSYFPFLMEMHYLLQMHLLGGPWAGMYAAQLFSAAMGILLVMAVYGGTKEILSLKGDCNPLAGATVAGVMAAAVPWVAMVGAVAYVENALLFYSTAALAWVMRAMARSEGRNRDMMVAGVLAGFACGVKYTAVPAVVALYTFGFVVVETLRWWREKEVGQGPPYVAPAIIFVAMAMVVFAPWAARNLAWSGNPVFPLGLRVLGAGRFDELQVERFERAHRAAQQDAGLSRRLAVVWERVLADRQYGYVLIPAGLAALAVMAKRRDAWLLMIFGTGQLIFFMGFTHLMPRFALGLVAVCAMGVGIYAGACGHRVAAWLGLAAAVAAALAGFAVLDPILRQQVQGPRQALFRMKDPAPLNPEEIAAAVKTDVPIALIGHSQPYMIMAPMRRVKYRMVFDVPSSGASDAVDAWLGISEEALRKSGHLIIVDPLELRRYASTYWKAPQLGGKPIAPGYVVVVPQGQRPPPGYAVQQPDGTWRVGQWPWRDAVGMHHIWRP